MLTLKQAAAQLGISPATLHTQIKRGVVHTVMFGSVHAITQAEVDRYRREHLGKKGAKWMREQRKKE